MVVTAAQQAAALESELQAAKTQLNALIVLCQATPPNMAQIQTDLELFGDCVQGITLGGGE